MPAERAYVPNTPATLMTAEELLHANIPDKRTELVRGVLIVREPPGGRHGSVTMNLSLRFGIHVERTGAGQVFAAETGFTLARGPDTVRAPDIASYGANASPSRSPSAEFGGEGACFVEMGRGRAGFATGNFYATPDTVVRLKTPRRRWHWAKVL